MSPPGVQQPQDHNTQPLCVRQLSRPPHWHPAVPGPRLPGLSQGLPQFQPGQQGGVGEGKTEQRWPGGRGQGPHVCREVPAGARPAPRHLSPGLWTRRHRSRRLHFRDSDSDPENQIVLPTETFGRSRRSQRSDWRPSAGCLPHYRGSESDTRDLLPTSSCQSSASGFQLAEEEIRFL